MSIARQQHRVVIVGAGSIGERHLRCFLATGRARVSFVEINGDLRDNIAARYPDAIPHATLDDAVAAGVDAAVIATPAPLHVPQSMWFAECGVHLLIEKPLSTGIAGIDELQTRVAERQLVASVGYVYRSHPALAAMQSAIAAGRFGDPLELVVVSGQHFPFYRPAYRETYYASRSSGGGAVQDAVTHLFDAGQWLAGPIRRVCADVDHQLLDGVDVEDTVHVLARQGDGVLATYAVNQHQAPNEVTITVVCSRGTARFEYHRNRWKAMTAPEQEWTIYAGPPLERDDLFTRQAAAFLDAIEDNGSPPCPLKDAVHTLHVNLAVLDSAEWQTWVSVLDHAAPPARSN